MALFRFPLQRKKNIEFYKLLGCSKKGTFTMNPDLRQWAIFITSTDECLEQADSFASFAPRMLGNFVYKYLKFFEAKCLAFILDPIEGYGEWDGKKIFGILPKETSHDGKIVTLTRAHIRLSKAAAFQTHTRPINNSLHASNGVEYSFGIGELPYLKQATFSVWSSKDAMKQFAYRTKEHNTAIQRARKESWFKEEMFIRFRLVQILEADLKT